MIDIENLRLCRKHLPKPFHVELGTEMVIKVHPPIMEAPFTEDTIVVSSEKSFIVNARYTFRTYARGGKAYWALVSVENDPASGGGDHD